MYKHVCALYFPKYIVVNVCLLTFYNSNQIASLTMSTVAQTPPPPPPALLYFYLMPKWTSDNISVMCTISDFTNLKLLNAGTEGKSEFLLK